MKIEYLGHACFAFTNEKGVKIVTDPYTGVGYELPNDLHADILTVSHSHFDHNYTAGVKGVRAIFDTAKTENALGVTVTGIATYHDEAQGALRGKNIVFVIQTDGLRICHLGDLGERYSQSLAQKIGEVDILLIPVGGRYTIDGTQAKEFVEKLAPKFAIPMHYRPHDGTIDITDATPFLSGYAQVIYPPKKSEITLEKSDLKVGKTQIIYMERE